MPRIWNVWPVPRWEDPGDQQPPRHRGRRQGGTVRRRKRHAAHHNRNGLWAQSPMVCLLAGSSHAGGSGVRVPAGGMASGVDGESRLNDLAFSPDGRYLAGDGGLVKKDDKWLTRILVWDTATGDLRHVWLGLRGFAFTRDSKRLAILHDPKTIK